MASRARGWLLAGGAVVAAMAVAGPRGGTSGRPPIHPVSDMDVQAKAEPQSASDFFYDGATMRPPVPGTVARGELRDGGSYWTGMGSAGFATNPLVLDAATLERGRRRYQIYCAVCHDENGDGKGLLFERAQVKTPSYHVDRLRQAPDGYLFAVVTNGFGLMPAYAYPIPVEDRWAIVAHVRTLQARRLARDGEAAGSPSP